MGYEYKVVPAPTKGAKVKGIKAPQDRFAHTIENLINELGAEGWVYLRSDTLPNERKSIFGARKVTDQSLLVFGREAFDAPVVEAEPYIDPAYREAKVEEPKVETAVAEEPAPAPEEPTASPSLGAATR